MEQISALDREVSRLVSAAVASSGRSVTDVCMESGIPRSTYYRATNHGTFNVRQLAAIARTLGLRVSVDLSPSEQSAAA